jgi:hypothetical protein
MRQSSQRLGHQQRRLSTPLRKAVSLTRCRRGLNEVPADADGKAYSGEMLEEGDSREQTARVSRCTQIPESPCRAPKTALKSRILARPYTQRPDKVDGGSLGTCQDLRAVRPRAEARRRPIRFFKRDSRKVEEVMPRIRLLQQVHPAPVTRDIVRCWYEAERQRVLRSAGPAIGPELFAMDRAVPEVDKGPFPRYVNSALPGETPRAEPFGDGNGMR